MCLTILIEEFLMESKAKRGTAKSKKH